MHTQDGVYLAQSDEEREAVFRLRYNVYVEELGRYGAIANHQERLFSEPIDGLSFLFYAIRNGEVAGTMRLTWGGRATFPGRQIHQYNLSPFLQEMEPDQIVVGERFMVTKPYRGSDLLFQLFCSYLEFVNERRIQLMFGDCEPHLLNVYQALGFRNYAADNINSPETGYLIPLVLIPEDIQYLRQVNSPLAGILKDFGDDARIPDCTGKLIDRPTAVLSERLVGIGPYWQEVYRSLSNLEDARISLFDGLSEEQIQACLAKSNVIDCSTGDRILKQGNPAQNIFVLLEGILEVRNREEVVGTILPGEVFGEIAFLLDRPRTRDVYAVVDDAKVVSLSESTIRSLTGSDPQAAAKLLLNIAKMLSWRLVRDSARP